MRILKPTAQILGSLLLLVLLAVAIRVALLPFPLGLSFATWTSPSEQLDARQVTRTEYFRGFFQTSRTFDATQSHALLAVLQGSLNFGGDTTPDFTQMLVYYDADGRVLGYTDLDVFDDVWLVTYMEPGGFRRGGIMHGAGRQQLLRLLGFTPPFTRANLQRCFIGSEQLAMTNEQPQEGVANVRSQLRVNRGRANCSLLIAH